jgi:hypothetical protein
MVVTLVVPDPPPHRPDPGRAADRHSPHALPLARAGEALVRANPAAFPLKFAEILVVFGRTFPDVDPLGYQPEQPIIEVLTDVGAVIEPEGWSMNHSQDPLADFYVVTFSA